MGAADRADEEVGKLTGLVDPATSDTGICDTCWCVTGGAPMQVSEVEEVHFESAVDVEELDLE